ncbi:FAD-dependent oxidoreductase [Amycolatopsis sp. K13G38]|uniref:FAD-dependent oxidoreductase n=1 Tax=Amycolatopsis acididurans TaxID=2724524 RepID=A0ABX1JAH9_9PSEU|nr:FAD-dependent oxidoreductase [Amycolatopsis acididurans]NKQ56291.1 FAD-dependent oxidoreductase [Amycolatopsis acididurans]
MTVRIVVAGAGYAGLAAAKLAARWTGGAVTLVNEHDRFVERVRLHQLAAGQQLRDRPLAELLEGTGVRLVVDRVTGVDAAAREVHTASGHGLGYDRLIYALGSHADMTSVPGVAEHAYTVAGFDRARMLRERLGDAQSVIVAGGGLTGIEAAAEIAETRPALKVRLVSGGVLGDALSERARRYLRRTFGRLGVEVRDGVRIAEVREDGVVLEQGEHLAADTVVWTAGFTVPAVAREAGFAVDAHGRMLVDDTLRSVSHPEVTAVGDAAAIRLADGQQLRMACATGLPTAQTAVRALAARLDGRAPKPVRFRYVNQCISLGRRDGLIQFVRADDSPREAVLTGRLAARYKETIVRGTVLFERHPTLPAGF